MKLYKLAFSLLFLTCFLAQLSVPLYHSFEDNHSGELCSANDIEHICNHDSENNNNYYFQLKLDFKTAYKDSFIVEQYINSSIFSKSNFLANHKKLSFSLRGPPNKI